MKVAVLGGGISGLAAAYHLKKNNIDVTVFESTSSCGGSIKSKYINDFLIELGPNSMLLDSTSNKLINDINLENRLIKPLDKSKKRFIVKNKQLHSVPLSFSELFNTPLLSLKSKFHLLIEPLITKTKSSDATVADFIERRISAEMVDNIIDPVVKGIYAGDPNKLSVKYAYPKLWDFEQKYGSILIGMKKFYKERKSKGKHPKKNQYSFINGMQELPNALSNLLDDNIKTNIEIENIDSSTEWKLIYKSQNKTFQENFDSIIFALPAHKINSLPTNKNLDKQFKILDEIDYAPITVVALGFRREQITHPLDGFGMLIPSNENCSTLGSIFSSSLFTGRVPDNNILITTFIGGTNNPEIYKKSNTQLEELVLKDLKILLGVKGTPLITEIINWPNAIPQYNFGYGEILKEINNIEKNLSGIFFSGNYLNGVSVSNCIQSGINSAEKIITSFN